MTIRMVNPLLIGFNKVRRPDDKRLIGKRPPPSAYRHFGRYKGEKRNGPMTPQERNAAVRNMLAYKAGYKSMKPKKIHQPRTPAQIKGIKEAREIQELARRSAPAALKALDDIINSKVASDLAKISAANALLDRGYGKALQTNVNATVNTDGSTKEIDGQELDRRVKETISKIEGLTKRKREKIQGTVRPPDLRQYN